MNESEVARPDRVEILMTGAKLEELLGWRKWDEEIPFIHWPGDWSVKAIPPVTGAVVRYKVKKPGDKIVSVYLDCYDILGFFGEPYWEIYPHNNDTFRCKMNDTTALLQAIEESGGM